MNKCTPGPWLYYRESSCDRGTSYGVKAPHPHYWVIPPLNINENDVRLIAAAPELLEALEWAVDNPHDDAYWISQARAAIAKAKGDTK